MPIGDLAPNRALSCALVVSSATLVCLAALPAKANGLIFINKTTANGLASNFLQGVYASGSSIYVSTNGAGLSISTNEGASFTTRTTTNGLGNNFVDDAYASSNSLYVATNSGLSISTDGGSTFSNRTTANGLVGNSVYDV